ncbi:hypothetical protein [Halobellus rufus]|uniref:hypothetical protein n=1 Tax=Halobellus rufus TaxID=1448860 RepID=UPI0006796B70|nr:hypothetical protein [Halobellus rufus]
MPSRIRDALFSEPSGRRAAAVMFAGSLAFAALYAYNWVVGRSAFVGGLALMLGSALSGVAESLPPDRRRAAGALRIAAVLVLLSLLVAIAVAPETIVDGR